MANSLPIDKELVKSLWLQGFTAPLIAEKTGVKVGTIRGWVSRYKWSQLGKKLRVENQGAQSSACQDVAERLAKATIEQCERIIAAMRDAKIKTLPECRTAAMAISAAYATAYKALGLDEPGGSRSLTLNVIMSRESAPRAALDVTATTEVVAEPASEQPSEPTEQPGDE